MGLQMLAQSQMTVNQYLPSSDEAKLTLILLTIDLHADQCRYTTKAAL
jgi:hypothetical protein